MEERQLVARQPLGPDSAVYAGEGNGPFEKGVINRVDLRVFLHGKIPENSCGV